METLSNKKKPIITTVLTVAGYVLILCNFFQFILYFVSPIATGKITADQLFQSVSFITVLTAIINLILNFFYGQFCFFDSYLLSNLGYYVYNLRNCTNAINNKKI